MITTYIVDTSVFIQDPRVINKLNNCEIIIPISVLEELDKLKKLVAEVGKNARLAIKELDKMTRSTNIVEGVVLKSNVRVKIDVMSYELVGTDQAYGDNKILACAINAAKHITNPVILLSRDINLRIRARAYGLLAEDYDKASDITNELYLGYKEINNKILGDKLQAVGCLNYSEFEKKTTSCLDPNEFILFSDGETGISMGRRIDSKIKIVKPFEPWGLVLRNKEQIFLTDLIMDPNVLLVSVIGKAGGGKSLVTMGSSLELVLNRKAYKRLIICRPIQTIAGDLGYLPGTLEEKLSPYYNAISDTFDFLFGGKNKKDKWQDNLFQYINSGVIQQEPITYMRGRSLHNSLIVVDEAQNLSQEDMKTILTRAGENSKIILTGDIEQLDNRNLDATNNGLTYVVDKFRSFDIAGHITLLKGERSKLASLAAQIL